MNQHAVTASETETAVRRLEQGFAIVGLTDHWDLSICLWHAMFFGKEEEEEDDDDDQFPVIYRDKFKKYTSGPDTFFQRKGSGLVCHSFHTRPGR